MAKSQCRQKPRRFLGPTGPPTAAWFPMMMLACHMMASNGFRQKPKSTRRKPKSSPMSVVNTREVASEPVDPAPVELSPAQGTLVNAQHLSSVSARAHDDRSHSGSEQTMSRLQQPVPLPSNGPCADLFAKACNWQLADFMPWSSLPRPPFGKISNFQGFETDTLLFLHLPGEGC